MLLLATLLVAACARQPEIKPTEPPQTVLAPWRIETYADFVRQNMAYLNAAYTTEYVPYDFVVDTDNGARPIQELMDVELAADLLEGIEDAGSPERQRIQRVFDFVRSNFVYRAEPERWSSVRDILKIGRADCKGLSLLLVSLLTAAGIESYAAISNGHMWVGVYDGSRWQVLETDTDPERNEIYTLPDFYEHPLYKIYPDVSLKRKPKARPTAD